MTTNHADIVHELVQELKTRYAQYGIDGKTLPTPDDYTQLHTTLALSAQQQAPGYTYYRSENLWRFTNKHLDIYAYLDTGTIRYTTAHTTTRKHATGAVHEIKTLLDNTPDWYKQLYNITWHLSYTQPQSRSQKLDRNRRSIRVLLNLDKTQYPQLDHHANAHHSITCEEILQAINNNNNNNN